MKLQSMLAALCLLAAIAAYALTPHLRLADLEPINLEQMIPTEFGEWKMEPTSEAIISSPEQDAFVKSIYSQVLSRTYVNRAGERIMLSIAYTRDQSDNSGTQSHKPEICYPAQGFKLNSIRNIKIETRYGFVDGIAMIAKQGDRTEPLIYWTTVGEMVNNARFSIKIAQMGYAVHNIIPDGMVFRVSSIGDDEGYQILGQKKFINEMVDSLSVKARHRIVGF